MLDDDIDDDIPSPFQSRPQRIVAGLVDILLFPVHALLQSVQRLREFLGFGHPVVTHDEEQPEDEQDTLAAQSLRSRIGSAISTPFALAGDWLARRFKTPVRDESQHVFDEDVIEAESRKSPTSWMLKIVALLCLPFVAIYFTIRGIIASLLDPDRLNRHLLLALPAVGIVVAMAAIYFIGGLESTETLKLRYSKEANDSFKAGNYERSRLCYRRLIQIDPDSQEDLYGLGVVMEKLKEMEHTAAIMERLAPATRTGYGPAHLWRARAYLAKQPNSATDQQMAESHLVRALSTRQTSREAELLLALIYAQTNRTNLAEPMLTKLAGDYAEAAFELARIQAGRGQRELAKLGFQRATAEYQRQLSQQPDNAGTRLKLAQAAALVGDLNYAERVLQEGLSLDPSGAFRLQIARLYMGWSESLSKTRDPSQIAMRDRLLENAVRQLEAIEPQSSEVMALMGGAYARLGRMDRAEPLLAEAAKSTPEINLELAQYFAERGDRVRTLKYANIALERLGERRKDPSASDDLILLIANAELLRGNFANAIEILSDRSKSSRNPAIVRAIGKVYLLWYDDPAARPDPRFATEKLDMLAQALATDNWNVEAISRLLRTSRANNSPQAKKSLELLRQMLGRGQAPATVHLLLGNDAFSRGELTVAQNHLRQAYQLDPRMIEIANNLAWATAFNPNGDLPQALTLINTALMHQPDHPELLDTRGQILAKMGKWSDALVDLEKCMKAKQGDPQFHRALVSVYENLGMKELAAQQRRMLENATRRLQTAPKG